MNEFKKDNGFTLIEITLVFGLIGMLLLLISTTYVTINKTYIKEAKKADNLEQARVVVNLITDNFREYEAGSCEVFIVDPNLNLKDHPEGAEGKVREIAFESSEDSTDKALITYDGNQVKLKDKVISPKNDVANNVTGFTVKRSGDLYDFVITVAQPGNDAIPEQTITVRTTVNVKYTK